MGDGRSEKQIPRGLKSPGDDKNKGPVAALKPPSKRLESEFFSSPLGL